MIKNGKMVATVFQDAKGQGAGAVQTAVKLAKGEQVQKNVFIPYQLITKDNYTNFTSKNLK